jgi:hypothetical protein
MPPLFISPLAKIAVATLGAGALVSWAVKETLRVKEELQRMQTAAEADASLRHTFPTLRRDPRTGDWRISG